MKQNINLTPKKKLAVAAAIAVLVLIAVGTGTVLAVGSYNESTSIGETNAQNFAFLDAGIDPAEALVERTEFDHEQGQFVYEVEFTHNGVEYEYWVKADDGSIVKKETELKKAPTPTPETEVPSTPVAYTLEQAKEIALADAGLTADQVTFIETETDKDDGNTYFELDFQTADTKYDYEINRLTGEIYSKSKESLPKPEPKPEVKELIGLEEAKKAALADAGVKAADAAYTKAELEEDDGRIYYDVEFKTTSAKYEYEIDGYTGKVLEKEKETIKTSTSSKPSSGSSSSGSSSSSKPSSSQISLAEAKSIAAKKAGLSAGSVTFTKAKLEKDDGRKVYDLEFYKGHMEYECEVDAATGKVLEYDSECEVCEKRSCTDSHEGHSKDHHDD